MRIRIWNTLRSVSPRSYGPSGDRLERFSCHFHWNSWEKEREEAAGGDEESWTRTAPSKNVGRDSSEFMAGRDHERREQTSILRV